VPISHERHDHETSSLGLSTRSLASGWYFEKHVIKRFYEGESSPRSPFDRQANHNLVNLSLGQVLIAES